MFNNRSLDQDNKEGGRRAKIVYLKCVICEARHKQEDMHSKVICNDCSIKYADPTSKSIVDLIEHIEKLRRMIAFQDVNNQNT